MPHKNLLVNFKNRGQEPFPMKRKMGNYGKMLPTHLKEDMEPPWPIPFRVFILSARVYHQRMW